MAAGVVKAAVSVALRGKNVDISWSPHFVGTLNSMAFLLLLSFVLACSTKSNLSRLTCASNYGERKGNKYIFEMSTLLKRSRNIRVRMYAIIFYQTFTLLFRKVHKMWARNSQFYRLFVP